jgi:hypothetical protein
VEFALELMSYDGVRLIDESLQDVDKAGCERLQSALNRQDDAELGRAIRAMAFQYALQETRKQAEHWKADALSRVLERKELARAERMMGD